MTDVRSTQVAVEVITTGPAAIDARSTQVAIEIITSVDETPLPSVINSGAILLVGLQ